MGYRVYSGGSMWGVSISSSASLVVFLIFRSWWAGPRCLWSWSPVLLPKTISWRGLALPGCIIKAFGPFCWLSFLFNNGESYVRAIVIEIFYMSINKLQVRSISKLPEDDNGPPNWCRLLRSLYFTVAAKITCSIELEYHQQQQSCLSYRCGFPPIR